MIEQDYRCNHFEIHIDDDDNLHLNCNKVQVQCYEHTYMHVDFYLNNKTIFILNRDFSSNTHSIKLTLYKPDTSSYDIVFNGTCSVEAVKYSLDFNDSSVCLVTVVFRSVNT